MTSYYDNNQIHFIMYLVKRLGRSWSIEIKVNEPPEAKPKIKVKSPAATSSTTNFN